MWKCKHNKAPERSSITINMNGIKQEMSAKLSMGKPP